MNWPWPWRKWLSVCPASALMAASQNLGSGLIAGWGDDAQQADWLPDLMNGKLRFGHLSPPVTALDPTATPLSIQENENGGVLDGGPVWLVNGAGADLLAVWAKGAEQTSFLLFPAADLAGAILDPGGRTGLDAIAPVLIDMEGLNLPASVFLAGQKPETMSWFTSAAALAHAAVGMGAARGAHEYALEYSKKRYQFGMPIGKFQAVRELLAEMALAVEAARQLTLKACAAHDAGQDQAQKLSHMARLMAVRCSAGATEQAVQVCGGYGYTKEYPVEKMMRLAQLCKVLDGGDQAQVQALAAAL